MEHADPVFRHCHAMHAKPMIFKLGSLQRVAGTVRYIYIYIYMHIYICQLGGERGAKRKSGGQRPRKGRISLRSACSVARNLSTGHNHLCLFREAGNRMFDGVSHVTCIVRSTRTKGALSLKSKSALSGKGFTLYLTRHKLYVVHTVSPLARPP